MQTGKVTVIERLGQSFDLLAEGESCLPRYAETVGGPDFVAIKSGPSTLGSTLNLGEWGTFTIDLQNSGTTDAWNLWVWDRFPNWPQGGMCDTTPVITSAQVFEADGVTPGRPPTSRAAIATGTADHGR